MNFTIEKITPFIQERKQCLVFNLKERPQPLMAVYENIKNILWQLPVTDLELLVGCQLEPVYFQKGDRLPSGHISRSSHLTIKSWKFVHVGIEKEIRVKNGHLCLPFTQIHDTYIFTRKKRRVVRIRDIQTNAYFIDIQSLEKLAGLKEQEFNLLQGAFIAPTFYKAGEISEQTMWPIYSDGVILKALNLRISGSYEDHHRINGSVKLQLPRPIILRENETEGQISDGWNSNTSLSSPSFEKYNGYNGFDDQAIDDAFNGEPEATWNVE